jgi:hypothetical protein
MPEKETKERARKAKREGKAPSTQAGEFVREEFHHAREGKHEVDSPEQAVAIGLSKARKAGVKVPRKKGGPAKKRTSRAASTRKTGSAKRSTAAKKGTTNRSRSTKKGTRTRSRRSR